MEVRFHLPGLRRNFPLNIVFTKLLAEHPEFFREGVTVGSFFGEFPTSLWNGGRNSRGDQCNAEYINAVIRTANEYGVAVRYTYTNMALDENDLQDAYCNYCLKAADNGKNGVIVVSPLLEQYLRDNYPNMKLTSSTCKQIRGIDGVNAELRKGYDMVVLDYNLNNHYDLLAQIEDKERCEILVNAACEPNCPRRGEHYRNISENQKVIAHNMRSPREEWKEVTPWTCKYCTGAGQNVYSIQGYLTYVSPDDIWNKYVPMGFRNFKIEGRTDNLFVVVEAFCHYMVLPEHQGVVRIHLLSQLERMNVLQMNQPKPTPFL